MAGDELDEVAAFAVGQRRRAGLRLLAVGALAAAPSIFLVTSPASLTLRWRIFLALAAIVGLTLVAIGAFTLARARAGIDPIVPRARISRR